MMVEVSVPAPSSAFPTRVCLVCKEPADGFHFGVLSCPACAAFFRRTVALKKEYSCGKGTGQCRLERGVRGMCSRCRFDLCLAVGMKKEAVQSSRDRLGRRGNDKPEPQPIPETPAVLVPAMEVRSLLPPRVPLFVTDEQAAPLLTRVRTAYRRLAEKRRLCRMMSQDYVPRRVKHAEVLGIFERDKPHMAEFLSCFPMDGIEKTQRKVLYCANLYRFSFLDGAYSTLTNSAGCERWALPDGNFIDLLDVRYLVTPIEKGSMFSEEENIIMFANFFSRYHSSLVSPMRQLAISDMELCALFLLAFYSRGEAGLNDHTDRLCAIMTEQVLRELTTLYSRAGPMSHFAMRLSHLLILLGPLQRLSDHLADTTIVGRLFNSSCECDRVFEMLSQADV